MNKTKIKKLDIFLSSHKKIAIIPHKNPDGDALVFEIVDQPIHGSISQQNNIIIYT